MIDFLSITWDVNPILFKLGPLTLRYYSILFVSGFPLGYMLFIWFFKREGLDTKILEPLLYILLLATIVGARLGHCFFYEPQYYLAHPLEILQPWKGGLASHGGAIGVLIGLWIYVKKYGKKNGFDFMWLIDRLVIAVCFAGCLIRLGNLMNSEIYGNPTDLPWGFIFLRKGEIIAKHPTQLYEAFSYLLLGFFLLGMYKYKLPKLKKGWIFGVFLIVLFGMRFLIEYIKEPQVAFENNMHLNMGQWLSVPFIIAGIIILILSYVYNKPAVLTPQQVKKNYCPPSKQNVKTKK
jgi:prolipoprotein diacylglyceryl transferase